MSWEGVSIEWTENDGAHNVGRCAWWKPPKPKKGQVSIFDRRMRIRDDSPGCSAFHHRDDDPSEDRRAFAVIQRESPFYGEPYVLVYDDGTDFRYLLYDTSSDGLEKIAAFLNVRLKLRDKV